MPDSRCGSEILEAEPALRRLAPASPSEAERALVREMLNADTTKIAVIDDDPTGTQTVAGVPLVTAWEDGELAWAMSAAKPVFAILTNTRSTSEERAAAINRTIGERLATVARRLDVGLRVISRSDSTLRGHFPAEPDALAAGLAAHGVTTDAVIVCPAYPQAGRVTVDNVHFVRSGDRMVAAAGTEYARDPAFGYRSSDLRDWIRERAGEQATVAALDLHEARTGGAPVVARRLLELRGRAGYVVANAVEQSDLDTLALGVALAEQQGMGLVYRTGPSFVTARAGWALPAPLTDRQLAVPAGPGLLVAGSHTALTTAQLEAAQTRHRLAAVPLDVDELLRGPAEAAAVTAGAAEQLGAALSVGDAALVTSRTSAHGALGPDSLRVSARVADALVSIVASVAADVPLSWLIAKGGITSHDMAVRALAATRAVVAGQLFPGQISVWELGEGSAQPGLMYVVFPGNVGDEQTLADAIDRLKGHR